MNKIHNIDEGRTLDYLIPAFFIFVFGAILFLVHSIFPIIGTITAFILVMLRSGIEIDVNNKRIRVYKSFSNIKSGNWINLQEIENAHLQYVKEDQVMNHRAGSTTVRTRSYNLFFHLADESSLSFHDFTDYKKAQEVIKILQKDCNISVGDQVELRKLANQH